MAKGTVYTSERSIRYDARSGLRIIRLAHGPALSTNLYFEQWYFTKDDSYVIFRAQRYGGRDAPWDVMRASTDGLELVQITGDDKVSGLVMCPATDSIFYQSGKELRRINAFDLTETVIAEAPGADPVYEGSLASIDAKGKFYYGQCYTDKGRAVLYKVDTARGDVAVLHESEQQNHIHVDPTGKTLSFNDINGGKSAPCLIDTDGTNLRPLFFNQFAHCTWFGDGKTMQGALLPPGNAIATVAEDDPKPKILASGRYYWHTGPSRDCKWIVSDTNWPQEGIFLLHVPSGNVAYVCDPKSSCSHPQWTHPHPALSWDMKFIIFNSDLTGIGQVYLVELPADFRKQITQGYECKPMVM